MEMHITRVEYEYSPQRGDVSQKVHLQINVYVYSPQRGDVSEQLHQ